MGMQAGDNPADYTVEEVNAYLASADKAERDRVYAAERGDGGKARSTVGLPEDAAAENVEPGDVEPEPIVNPMSDPEYAAKAHDPDDDSVPTPTQPGEMQTPEQKQAAEDQDAEQQAAIAAAQNPEA